MFPVNTIPDKVGKPAHTQCLCGSQANGFEDLVDYSLTSFVSVNHNLAVPLYLIHVVSRAVHETRAKH